MRAIAFEKLPVAATLASLFSEGKLRSDAGVTATESQMQSPWIQHATAGDFLTPAGWVWYDFARKLLYFIRVKVMRLSLIGKFISILLLLASSLFAKPGVVTVLEGQTYGGDVTEDDKFVYIDTANGKITIDKRTDRKNRPQYQIFERRGTRH
jgi:hypothetical protein